MAPTARIHSFIAASAGALAVALLTSGCSGGGSDNPAPIATAPCSSNTCSGSGATTQPTPPTVLCPATLDYTTTYTGGSGSGEYVKVKFDTSKKQYQMTFIESEVPTTAGQVNTTRAGLTITGDFQNADQYQVKNAQGVATTPLKLPTAEQNRCAFVLENGQTADGSYKVAINPNNPPMMFVGQGIVGGGIPGSTVQFDGLQLAPGVYVATVPSKTFDYYPFIAFTQTVTDFSKIAGHYNELGIHFTPSGGAFQTNADNPTGNYLGWQVDGIQLAETINSDGSCAPDSGQTYTSCPTTGGNWTLRTNTDGSPDNVFTSAANLNSDTGTVFPNAGAGTLRAAFGGDQAHGIMIAGQLNGQIVPVVIRVGYAHSGTSLFDSTVDDQLGISLLAPVQAIATSSLTGAFIGANSVTACGLVTANGPTSTSPTVYEGACLDNATTTNAGVNYTSTIFQGTTAAFLNPFTSTAATNFTLDYTQTQPGLVQVTAQNNFTSGAATVFKTGDTGYMIKVGNVFAVLMNGTGLPNPFFTIGAFVQ
ncbi:hypothetical protein C0Z18_22170 [Trinickia dabaoshanensis]|uniref:DUF2957 domain-containing protein n=1 Tax=Trinickia dabaoshanensis TaxID=564714 RepID=A0A2N7VI74_9BURK|nr:DUF2957 domain-containing protein [Trinickia dabaoshanensis]PMS16855.1 hypothetical protein C0Z18_22170 [Trinickia dabaoshanensis]